MLSSMPRSVLSCSDCHFFEKITEEYFEKQVLSSLTENSNNPSLERKSSDFNYGALFSSNYWSGETEAGSGESQKSPQQSSIEDQKKIHENEEQESLFGDSLDFDNFSSFTPKECNFLEVYTKPVFKIIRYPPAKLYFAKKSKKQTFEIIRNQPKKKASIFTKKAITKKHLKPNRKERQERANIANRNQKPKGSNPTTQMKGMPSTLRTALHSSYYCQRIDHSFEGRKVDEKHFARIENLYTNPCISEIIRSNEVSERVLQKFDHFISHMCLWDNEISEIKSYKQFMKALETYDDQEVTDLCEKFVMGILSDDLWIEESQAEPKTKVRFKEKREEFKKNFSAQFVDFKKQKLSEPP